MRRKSGAAREQRPRPTQEPPSRRPSSKPATPAKARQKASRAEPSRIKDSRTQTARTETTRTETTRTDTARQKPGAPGRPRSGEASIDAELAIRDAALSLFASSNFSAVSIKDIAAATGFNTALIYYYFGSKEELFRRTVALAIERAFEHFRLSRQSLSRPSEVIDGWLETHVRECDTITKLVRIAIDYAGTATRKASIDNAIRRFYQQEREVLREALEQGIAAGDFRAVDIDRTATFISTFLDGVIVRAVILRDFDPKAAIDELRSFLASMLAKA